MTAASDALEAAGFGGRLFLTTVEVGRLFGVEPQCVGGWIRHGHLHAIQMRGQRSHWHVPATAIEALLDTPDGVTVHGP